MPEQVKFTHTPPAASTHNLSRGEYLRLCYYQKRGLKPPERKPVSRATVAELRCRIHARQLRKLMTALFAAGRLDQYRLRST